VVEDRKRSDWMRFESMCGGEDKGLDVALHISFCNNNKTNRDWWGQHVKGLCGCGCINKYNIFEWTLYFLDIHSIISAIIRH